MLYIYKLIVSFILGAIEGITEFLPISSTGHIILIENFLHYTDDSMQIFIVIVQLGAITSVLVKFRNRLYHMSVNFMLNIFNKQYCTSDCFYISHILIGTIPGVLVGAYFYEKIRLLFFDPIYIVYGLISGGVLLLISEWSIFTALASTSKVNNITYAQAFCIGCFQCLAFWPGFSRSGSTIGGGILMGLSRKLATEFSFFLAIPIVLGSTILTIYRQNFHFDMINIIPLIVGFLSAFFIAMITIQFFLKIIQRVSFLPFIIYRFILAVIIYC